MPMLERHLSKIADAYDHMLSYNSSWLICTDLCHFNLFELIKQRLYVVRKCLGTKADLANYHQRLAENALIHYSDQTTE
jgi:hypothetical protein